MEGMDCVVVSSPNGKLVGTIQSQTQKENLFAAATRGGGDDGLYLSAGPGLKQNQDPTNVVHKSQGKNHYVVSPWGVNNLFPDALIGIVYNNNLLPGLCEFKEDMIFGRGIRFVDQNGKEVVDRRLTRWLDTWDAESYIQSQIGDFVILYNTFTHFIKSRDGKTISHLEHVPAEECRCTVMRNNRVENILVADWTYTENDFKAYPTFDPRRSIEQQPDVTIYHSFRRSPGYKYYGMPRYIGALHFWVPLLNRIPEYHLQLMRNSMSAIYHIEIPYEPIEKMRTANGWSHAEARKWIDDKVAALEECLAGSSNAGKTFYTFATKDPNSNALFSWKISPIDNKIKQLSEGYLELFNNGNQALTSALQVQPSLACIQLGDKMSSGSEVLNSYNLHMQTRTQLPRKVVLAPLNTALKINFPDLDVRACFDNVLLVHQAMDKSGIDEGGIA